ncbi:hypothetical protein ACMBCN_00835 [Candidatus Liberibacter asiaticus]
MGLNFNASFLSFTTFSYLFSSSSSSSNSFELSLSLSSSKLFTSSFFSLLSSNSFL